MTGNATPVRRLATPPSPGRDGLAWLPAVLRQHWADYRLGDLVPGLSESSSQRAIKVLDAHFVPATGERREIIRALERLLSDRSEEIAQIPILEPAGGRLDLTAMPGWPATAMRVACEADALSLDSPPTFGALLAVPFVSASDVLTAVCVVEVLARGPEGAPAPPPAPSDDGLLATDALGVELASCIVDLLGMPHDRAAAIAARLGATSRRVPTLADIGQDLGLSYERARQLVFLASRRLQMEKPALVSVEVLRTVLVAAAAAGSIALAATLGRLTRDAQRLSDLIANLGDVRLADLISKSAQELDARFRRDVRILVHDSGAIAIARVVGVLEEWDCTQEEVAWACGGDDTVSIVDDIAMTTSDNSLAVVSVRRGLGAHTPLTVASAYGACSRGLRARGLRAVPTLDEFRQLLLHHPSLEVVGDEVRSAATPTQPTGLDEVLLELIGMAPGGLGSAHLLADGAARYGYSRNSALQYCNSSPVLDLACAGVYRRRGKCFDLSLAEELRSHASGPARWAQWGWLDRERFWALSSLVESGIRPALPRDVEALLAGRTFSLQGIDRSLLGTVDFSVEGTVKIDRPGAAEPLDSIRHLLEFRIGEDPRLTVIDVEDREGGERKPADIDSCVLHDGEWCQVIHVDQRLLDGSPCLMPAVLVPRELRMGQEVSLTASGCSTPMILGREPIGGALRGLGACLAELGVAAGAWLRVFVWADSLDITLLGRVSQAGVDELMVAIGLVAGGSHPQPVAAAASALGLARHSSRRDVVAALRRRRRPDLARMALRARVQDPVEVPDGEGRLLVTIDERGRAVVGGPEGIVAPAPPHALARMVPFGLNWVAGLPETDDALWARWVEALLRLLVADIASRGHVFQVQEGRWTCDERSYPRLLEAMESVKLEAGLQASIPSMPAGSFPTTGLGFVQLFRGATEKGLTSFAFHAGEIIVTWRHGQECQIPLHRILELADGDRSSSLPLVSGR